MSQNLELPENQGSPLPLQLAASSAEQMVSQREYLLAWFKEKEKEECSNFNELKEALSSAQKHKWATSALARQVTRSSQRIEFFRKASAAIKAGFTLVPNFPIDFFAIRISRESPTGKTQTSSYGTLRVVDEEAEILPQGEGRYVSTRPVATSWTEESKNADATKKIWHHAKAEKFKALDFPVAVAHPVVMDATANAIRLKLFDAIGICSNATNAGSNRKGDPLVIGRIMLPIQGYTQKSLSFLIAWHVNLKTL